MADKKKLRRIVIVLTEEEYQLAVATLPPYMTWKEYVTGNRISR